MDIKELSYIYSYSILTIADKYFIPGDKDTAVEDEFNMVAVEYLSQSFLGSGWIFDRDGINIIKRYFKEQTISFVEIDALHIVFSKAQG